MVLFDHNDYMLRPRQALSKRGRADKKCAAYNRDTDSAYELRAAGFPPDEAHKLNFSFLWIGRWRISTFLFSVYAGSPGKWTVACRTLSRNLFQPSRKVPATVSVSPRNHPGTSSPRKLAPQIPACPSTLPRRNHSAIPNMRRNDDQWRS